MSQRPLNVLSIIVHDLGRRLNCYGASDVRSPNLDALAASGVRFANNFCGAPQCLPSRAGIWTGHYPHDTGLVCFPDTCELRPDVEHIAAILARQGWETHIFGMQHVVHKVIEEPYNPERRRRLGFQVDHGRAGPAAREADNVVAWLEQIPADRPPFYTHVGFYEPHRDFPHADTETRPLDEIIVPPSLPDLPGTREDLAEMEASICSMDRAVGRILAALDRSGRADETVVIFTADHGIPFPRAKASLYDPGIETALLMRVPGGPSGRVVEGISAHVDLVPTLLDLLGMEIPGHMQGLSRRDQLMGTTDQGREEIFAGKTRHTWWDPMRCIRTDGWKLIVNFDYQYGPEWAADFWRGQMFRDVAAQKLYHTMHSAQPMFELYDLAEDPSEQTNLAEQEAHAAVRDDLARRLRTWMEETRDPLLDPTFHSRHFNERMESLRNI